MHGRAGLLVVLILLQACAPPQRAQQAPILEFPEVGVDDPAAYEGYTTRFFQDAAGNTFQIYLDQRDGRVVHVWADAANESAAFTVRNAEGRPAPVGWGGTGAAVESRGRERIMRYRLAAGSGAIEIGWFLLGTMRQERDFQGIGWHRRPWGGVPFVLPELMGLVASIEDLPAEESAQHLALLDAADVEELRSRLTPRLTLSDDATWTVLVEHTSLDGRNRMTLELGGNAATSTATLAGDRVMVRAADDGRIELDVVVTTDSDALSPLGRDRLFNDAFKRYVGRRRQEADSIRRAVPAAEAPDNARLMALRRLERQVLGLELLSSAEKLMASMPNYATYFGRDQMMSAFMLEPISSVDLQELVIASVLGKLSPTGHVSHEEALGGQAIRENAAEYSELIRTWQDARESDPDAAGEALAEARAILQHLQAVRENYRMIDDDFQLSVLVDRYLARSDVPDARKRRFLAELGSNGLTRLHALVRNLAFVADLARPYAEEPTATNLVGFQYRDANGYLPGSWRDSRAGYGNGRFAMDVNVVWVPKALEATERILQEIDTLSLSAVDALVDAPMDGMALQAFLDDPETLRAAVETWSDARAHFAVRLQPTAIRERVAAALASLPAAERDFWRRHMDTADRPLAFLALALDSAGRPISAANTDLATDLFIQEYTEQVVRGDVDPDEVLQLVDAAIRPYPVGLFVEGVGPVVVNDVYARREVQEQFREDLYHSPHVAWGREANLLLLGLAKQIGAAYDTSGRLRDEGKDLAAYVEALRHALERTATAVEASGLSHNELWSYAIEGDTLRPVRYGTSSDIQLWNVTDLAVGFLLDQLPAP